MLLSLVRIFCNPRDGSLPESSVYGVSQARILEWVAMPFSRGSSRPRDRTQSPSAMRETCVPSLGQEDTLEEEKAIHPRILAWGIPRTEESGGLQPTGWVGAKEWDMT